MISSRSAAPTNTVQEALAKPLHTISGNTQDLSPRFQQALEQIQSLRNEPINKLIDKNLTSKLCSEKAAERSFALLSEQVGFWPTALFGAAVPQFVVRNPKYAHVPDLFQFLLQGEIHGATLLLMAQENGSGSKPGDCPSPEFPNKVSLVSKAYTSYRSRLAVSQHRAACAAACAVIFPRWARICKRLVMDVFDTDNDAERKAALLKFFSTSTKQVDEMAAVILMQEDCKSCSYQDLFHHAKLIQEYELLFWNSSDVVCEFKAVRRRVAKIAKSA